jgi:anti-sigma regulatory factor (Ser/Thr protein kinase)
MGKFMSTETPEEIKRPGRTEAIEPLVSFVSTHAREMAFDEAKVREIGDALRETLENIVQFACSDGRREITVTCTEHEMGALVMEIRDSGAPFNMLAATSFPETADFLNPGQTMSTRKMKRTFKNIEYRRDAERRENILLCTVSRPGSRP